MRIKIFAAFILSAYAVMSGQNGAKMLREADNFIYDMNPMLQVMQAQGIRRSIKGDFSELNSIRNSRNKSGEIDKGVIAKDIKIIISNGNQLSARLYQTEADSNLRRPLLVYFHGGGWVLGSNNSCAAFCSALAATKKVNVLSVEYPLAPEHSGDEILHACVDACRYAIENAASFGSESAMVSVGGDSAGGTLAIASAARLAESKKWRLKSVVAIYPVTQSGADRSASWHQYGRGYGLDADLMESFFEALKAKGDIPKNFMPMDIPEAILKRLPPMLIIGAQRDILCDQGKAFYERARAAGANCRRTEFPGSVHLFITVEGQPEAFSSAVAITSDFLSVGTKK